jgi:hypothetical protein
MISNFSLLIVEKVYLDFKLSTVETLTKKLMIANQCKNNRQSRNTRLCL